MRKRPALVMSMRTRTLTLTVLAVVVTAALPAGAQAQSLSGVPSECVIQQRWADAPDADGNPVILIDRASCHAPVTYTPSDEECIVRVLQKLYWATDPDVWPPLLMADGSHLEQGWGTAEIHQGDPDSGNVILNLHPNAGDSNSWYMPVQGERLLGTDYLMAARECGSPPGGTYTLSGQHQLRFILRGPGALPGEGGGGGGGGGSGNPSDEIKVERFRLVFMSFIPANYLDLPHPEATCRDRRDPITGSGNRRIKLLIGHGDDRGFNRRAADRRPDQWHSFKSLQEVTVERRMRGAELLSMGIVPGTEKTAIGMSESYLGRGRYGTFDRRFGALDHGKKNLIDESDKDKRTGDCRLRHGHKPGRRQSLPQPTGSQPRRGILRVNLTGKVKNGLIFFSPSIDWNLTVDIYMERTIPDAVVSGRHDRFPAYEMYLEAKQVYRYLPKGIRGKTLPVRRVNLDVLGLFDSHSLPGPILVPSRAGSSRLQGVAERVGAAPRVAASGWPIQATSGWPAQTVLDRLGLGFDS